MLDGEMGSMQEFIPDAKTFSEVKRDATEGGYDSLLNKHKADLMKMWIFDIIIGNSDRHGGNFLIQDDTLYAIDHGYSLNHQGPSFQHKIWLNHGFRKFFDEQLPQELITGIKNFLERPEEQQILEELLSELFDKQYASVCLRRIKTVGEILVKNGKISRPQGDDYWAYEISII